MDVAIRTELWTVDDAAAQLHPEMTPAQVRALILIAGLQPLGRKPAGRYGGRPPAVYDGEQLRQAHAVGRAPAGGTCGFVTN
ncbi:hypothetical protein [Planotetraspora kaengkrachanensis]|uniref:hypothetical protein n=1 Tax=Planotetraspora kaengkrachanensis TaxID=575193 RepID=UPI00194256DB|nr:hypothetical protein [Planotetraspora kaengkrachanensis]